MGEKGWTVTTYRRSWSGSFDLGMRLIVERWPGRFLELRLILTLGRSGWELQMWKRLARP